MDIKADLLLSGNNQEVTRLLVANTIGLSILSETLLTASRIVFESTGKVKKSESTLCYLWVQGTGLDNLLLDYRLDYNPDDIRTGFNYYMRHRNNGKH